MGVREGFDLYYGSCGLKGVLSVTSYRLLKRPRRIRARCPGVAHPIELRLGTTDASLFRSILRSREYDFDLPFPPRTIIDGGANIGMASIYFANKYPGAKIIAVEAEESNFEMLCRNCRLYTNITPLWAALWDCDGEIAVAAPNGDLDTSDKWGFVTHQGPGRKVRAITISTLMREMSIDSVDVLKIDIEGSEKEVFSSCGWAEKTSCVMVEVHERLRPGCTAAVDAAMTGFCVSQRGETMLYVRRHDSEARSLQ